MYNIIIDQKFKTKKMGWIIYWMKKQQVDANLLDWVIFQRKYSLNGYKHIDEDLISDSKSSDSESTEISCPINSIDER